MVKRVYTSEVEATEELPEPITFKLDGVEYILRELGPLDLSEIARMDGKDADDPKSIAFMAEFFNTALGNQQYEEFRARTGKFSTRVDVFVKIIEGIFEDLSGRNPTQPSASSGGRENTAPSSTADSSLLDDRVLARLEGRPDLQMAVMAAKRVREGG